MALTYVVGKTVTFPGSASNRVVSLSFGGGLGPQPQTDDIVIITDAAGSTSDAALSVVSSGWTTDQELYRNGTSADTNLAVHWKIMGGSPDAFVTLSSTGGSANAGAVAVQVWRGADLTTPFNVASTTATGSGAGHPNPPSITPLTPGSVVIACGGAGVGSSGSDFISTLDNFITASSADTTDAVVGMGSVNWTSGAVNPAAWTGGSGGTDSWAAVSMVLKPAGGTAYSLSCATGSFAVTGKDASFPRGLKMTAGTGAFTLTGQNASFAGTHILTMPAATGSFLVTGQDVTLFRNLFITAATGAFTLTGQAVAFSRTKILMAETGAFILTGKAASFVFVPVWRFFPDSPALSFGFTVDPAPTGWIFTPDLHH